jgi:hypothetical protein
LAWHAACFVLRASARARDRFEQTAWPRAGPRFCRVSVTFVSRCAVECTGSPVINKSVSCCVWRVYGVCRVWRLPRPRRRRHEGQVEGQVSQAGKQALGLGTWAVADHGHVWLPPPTVDIDVFPSIQRGEGYTTRTNRRRKTEFERSLPRRVDEVSVIKSARGNRAYPRLGVHGNSGPVDDLGGSWPLQ